MTKVVSDSTPLILLAKIGRLELLKDLYKKIIIPEAVFDEVVSKGKTLQMPDAYIIEKAVGDWIIRSPIRPDVEIEYSFLNTNMRLDKGEKEALKLCKQLEATYFIADDNEARKTSKILNIKTIGTLGTVIQAHKLEYITKKEALTIIDDLIKAGLRINTILYRRILEEIETPP